MHCAQTAKDKLCVPMHCVARMKCDHVSSRQQTCLEGFLHAYRCGTWSFNRALVNAPARIMAPAFYLWDQAACHTVRINECVDGVEVACPGIDEGRVILYFHGGGHCLFSVWTHRELAGRISAATRARVIAVNYRKAPNNPFPAALEDALASWRWVRKHHSVATSIAVIGDSAGGNLAFALLVRLAQLEEPQPIACVGLSPWLLLDPDIVAEHRQCEHLSAPQRQGKHGPAAGRNFSKPCASNCQAAMKGLWDFGARKCAARYVRGHPTTDPLVSPVLADVSLARRFPPILIHACVDEPLSIDAIAMAKLCGEAEVPIELKLYRGSLHVMQANPFGKGPKDSLARLNVFLERHWQPSVIPMWL